MCARTCLCVCVCVISILTQVEGNQKMVQVADNYVIFHQVFPPVVINR